MIRLNELTSDSTNAASEPIEASAMRRPMSSLVSWC